MNAFSDLSHLMLPRSIALIGASERPQSVGGRTLENLTRYSRLAGKLHLVNPTKSAINGMPCLPSVSAIDDDLDLAIVAVKAESVLEALQECANKGVKFSIVFTSGFGEAGHDGKFAEERMLRIAQETGMRIYGPNCPGLNNINAGLGMTFSPAWQLDQMPGPIGLATQGGGMGRTVLQAMARGIGTGLWCSAGNEVDLEVSDFIHYMATADDIKVIATNLEGIRNGPRFLEACQHAARNGKPVIAMKIGKSEYGVKAAQSHTAAISGTAEINSAVFRELGVIEVDDVDELVDIAALLARGQATGREKLAVFCYSGGTAALAADKIGSANLTLATFSDPTLDRLRAQLPEYASIDNPVDTTGIVLTNPELGYEALKTVSMDPEVGAVLYPIPFDYGDITNQAAQSAVRLQGEIDKPIVMAWMSDKPGQGFPALVEGGMVPARSVTNAVNALCRYIDHGDWQSSYDTNWRPYELTREASASAERIVAAHGTHREHEAKAILTAAGIPVPRSAVVSDRDAAARAFTRLEIGKAAMKIVSATITHKSDVGGVRLGIDSAAQASSAFDAIMDAVTSQAPGNVLDGVLVEEMLDAPFAEVVVGIHRDPVFGPVCTVGLGGIAIELFKDVSRRLLPLDETRARQMIAETRCSKLLAGFRGKPPFDVDALVKALVCLSDFVVQHPEIEEVEINPLAVRVEGQGVVALDAVLSVKQGAN
ncbi:acyl-CoA synthetase (plasmid) [Paraburkholderia sp. PGU19]|uniref:acetate--CoA ligase family protein n=1 Tax=Paraburkholderia sp. PGU19 TaxID=2735434 RepID=UPI0015DA7AC1|nr:acetate--CoA ligase family protein [Paraburkholderia sp. PGU19]BCG04448.1 acyl-CoA synthetase [Paraburkholderia sp. PGU19]